MAPRRKSARLCVGIMTLTFGMVVFKDQDSHRGTEHTEILISNSLLRSFVLLWLRVFAARANVSNVAIETGISSRQDAKSGSLRPLRLCARYAEFWLRLCRGRPPW